MLLHVCCAPDLVPAYFHMKEKIKYIYFYNPNIHPKNEYEKRFNEVLKLAKMWNLKIIESKYEPEVYFKHVKGLENLGINSPRCDKCIYLLLKNTAITAKTNNFDSFATTLTSSPRKVLEKINKIGKIVEQEVNVKYIETYFRKGKEYQEALKFIKEQNIYRQAYCGCIFSKIELENKRKEKIEKSKKILKEYGITNIPVFPEKLVITKENFEIFSKNFIEIIKVIQPKILYIDDFVKDKYNLKEGWNKFGNYNQKIQTLKGNG